MTHLFQVLVDSITNLSEQGLVHLEILLGDVVEAVAAVDEDRDQEHHVTQESSSVDDDSHDGEGHDFDEAPDHFGHDDDAAE